MSSEQLVIGQIDTLWNRLSPQVKDVYMDSYKDLVNGCRSVSNASEERNHLKDVVHNIMKAVTNRHPKNHYLSGNRIDVLFLVYILPLIPSFISDSIIKFYSKKLKSIDS